MSYTSGVAHVEFIGGPMDGHTRAVPLGLDGQPAPRITLETLGAPEPGSRTMPVVVINYLRRVSPRDEDGLWEYVWVPPAGHAERLQAALDDNR